MTYVINLGVVFMVCFLLTGFCFSTDVPGFVETYDAPNTHDVFAFSFVRLRRGKLQSKLFVGVVGLMKSVDVPGQTARERRPGGLQNARERRPGGLQTVVTWLIWRSSFTSTQEFWGGLGPCELTAGRN